MSLIDQTYFQKRKTSIPNINQPEVLAELNDYIAIYEPDYLINVLGRDLKTDFETGIEQATPDQKWLNLRDGAEFEYKDVKYTWKGFVRTTKESPIAYYVMYWFVRETNVQFTGVGTTISISENSERISPSRRLVSLWNDMVSDNEILVKFLLANESDYTNYAPENTLTEIIDIYGI